MASYRTFKGAQLDLEFYQGKATIDYPIQVLTDNGDEFNLSVYSSIVCKVYYRKHGELIITPTTSTSGSYIYLDATMAQTLSLQTREYWYECYGVLISPVSEEELICYGVFKNI